MSPLGLDFIYDLVVTDVQERKDILKYYGASREFLLEALWWTSSPPVQYAKISGWVDGSSSTCNRGWLEYGSPKVGVSGLSFEQSSLQAGGYVFWDSQRIRLPGFGEPYPEEVRAILDRRDRKSVQSRLKALELRYSDLKHIVEEF
ncbi:hypothetical protein DL771_009544 [Monosporascus sp. 5C6A]|nr:hypothetical protein DL771_009544 [Monosporascus sp. 5C6A]